MGEWVVGFTKKTRLPGWFFFCLLLFCPMLDPSWWWVGGWVLVEDGWNGIEYCFYLLFLFDNSSTLLFSVV